MDARERAYCGRGQPAFCHLVAADQKPAETASELMMQEGQQD